MSNSWGGQYHTDTDVRVGEDGSLCNICLSRLASIHIVEHYEYVDNETEQRVIDVANFHYCTGCAIQKLRDDLGISIDDESTPTDGSNPHDL